MDKSRATGTYIILTVKRITYDHRTLKTRLPVRSALFKQRTGGLVVRWVTTSEYPLLYVFALLCLIATAGPRQGTAFWKATLDPAPLGKRTSSNFGLVSIDPEFW